MGIVTVKDANTGKLKRYENEIGKILAEVQGRKLILSNLGIKAGYTARGLLLMRNGLPAC